MLNAGIGQQVVTIESRKQYTIFKPFLFYFFLINKLICERFNTFNTIKSVVQYFFVLKNLLIIFIYTIT